LPQKAKSAGFSKPHCGQEGVSVVPHFPQKLMPSGFSNPQLAQRMELLYNPPFGLGKSVGSEMAVRP
jgi:hypothetical protein